MGLWHLGIKGLRHVPLPTPLSEQTIPHRLLHYYGHYRSGSHCLSAGRFAAVQPYLCRMEIAARRRGVSEFLHYSYRQRRF